LIDKEIPAMSRSLLVPTALAVAAVFCSGIVPGGNGTRVAVAQDSVLTELYGEGVHAFHARDLTRAYDLFTRAIDGGLNDPRAFYFRGLTAMESGRSYEAEEDFRAGAAIEARNGTGGSVGRALTRVQGSARMMIEKARTEGRLSAQAEMAADAARRYSGQQAIEAEVLQAPPTPRPRPAMPGVQPLPVPAAGSPSPFDNDSAAGQPKVQSADVLEDAMVDPFADDGAPAPAAPGDAPAADPSDPFGGGAAPAASDPFGAPPAGGAPAADPFGAPPAGGAPAADPFGT
jgi:hypothetical protein